MLSNSDGFPYDALDIILCFACDASTKRAAELGRVCRFWHDRFLAAHGVWQLIGTQMRQRGAQLAPNWSNAAKLRAAGAAAHRLKPLEDSTLHPIEDCTLEYACPMYVEALREVSPGVSYCEGCKQNVYLVRTQRELQQRRAAGHCVMMRSGDIAPNALDVTVVTVWVLADNADAAKHLHRQIARGQTARSASVFPVLEIGLAPTLRFVSVDPSGDARAADPNFKPSFCWDVRQTPEMRSLNAVLRTVAELKSQGAYECRQRWSSDRSAAQVDLVVATLMLRFNPFHLDSVRMGLTLPPGREQEPVQVPSNVPAKRRCDVS